MHGQQPSVGRDVHYVAPGDATGRFPKEHNAAKIIAVQGEWNADDPNSVKVTLRVWPERGEHTQYDVPYDETGEKPFSWHWPERV